MRVATETWPPNVPVAAARLRRAGGSVVWSQPAPDNIDQLAALACHPSIPFRDGAFDVVLDRHESFVASEVRRVLRAGGRFLTRQVGRRNLAELDHMLGVPFPYAGWDLDMCCAQIEGSGMRVVDTADVLTERVFATVDEVLRYLDEDP